MPVKAASMGSAAWTDSEAGLETDDPLVVSVVTEPWVTLEPEVPFVSPRPNIEAVHPVRQSRQTRRGSRYFTPDLYMGNTLSSDLSL